MSSVEEKASKKPSVKLQISHIKIVHEGLSQRSADIKAAPELLPEVRDFIDLLRKTGREVPPGTDRDLLISLASYWATYYFQHSEENTYPPTTLEPYLGPAKGEGTGTITGVFQQMLTKPEPTSSWGAGSAQEQSAPQAAATWFLNQSLIGRILVIAAPLVLIGLIIFLIIKGTNTVNPFPPTTLEPVATTPDQSGTQVAMATNDALMTENAAVPLASATLPLVSTATSDQIQTPSSVETALPQDTPIPTQTPGSGIENQGVSVLLNNLNDLQEVLPQMELNVSFANFSSGWSVHLLLQPLSKGLTYYPVPDFYLVEKGYGSGDWNVTVSFGTNTDLDYREQYAITPVMATSDAAREALAAATQTGLEQLPEGVFTSPQLITRIYTVVRRAYTVINEVRVVYSAYPPKYTNTDLFAMLPDGTDPLQLTDTPEISERYPGLSPDGTHIAFVGRTQISRDGPRVYSLWIMNSDGSNRINVDQDPELVYDRPLWSPDGKTLVYNTSPADASAKGALSSWAIYLYDLAADRTNRLDTGLTFARQPTWTPDGKTLYFSALNPETGTLGIYQISLESLEVSRVYDEKNNEIQPMVSPDGSRLLFLDYDSRELYVLDLATGQVELIKTPSVLDLGYAVWSPDGESIYFEANVSSAYSIWMVNLEEANPIQLTPGSTELDPSVGLLMVYLPK